MWSDEPPTSPAPPPPFTTLNSLAVASLVTGLFALLCLPIACCGTLVGLPCPSLLALPLAPLAAIAAIVLGLVARVQILRFQQDGLPLANAGLLTGTIALILLLVLLIVFLLLLLLGVSLFHIPDRWLLPLPWPLPAAL